MATGKASAKVVDFSNVKEAGEFAPRRVPAGDYAAKIVKVADGKSSKDNEFQYVFSIKLTQFSQNSYPYYCKLQENQLWKLRNLLLAGGINVPKKKAQIDPNRLVGKTIGVTMGDDEYEGKEKSTIEAVFPASELDDSGHAASEDDDGDDEEAYLEGSDDEDEDVEPESDEEEDEDGDQFDLMDRTALKAYLKAQDSTFQAKKSQTDDDLRDLARATDSEESADDDEEDEEEEPPPPPKKTKKAKAKAKKQTDDEELEELNIDDL